MWHGLIQILPSMDILNKLFKNLKASRFKKGRKKGKGTVTFDVEDSSADSSRSRSMESSKTEMERMIARARQLERIYKGNELE